MKGREKEQKMEVMQHQIYDLRNRFKQLEKKYNGKTNENRQLASDVINLYMEL